MKNFPIYAGAGIPIAATAASSATLVALTPAEVGCNDIMIDNPGPNDVFVRAGDAGVTASAAASIRVPAGSLQPWAKGIGSTHLAVVCKAGQTQGVVVFIGEGA